MPNGGTATIKIEATDARGAKVTKEFQVIIEKYRQISKLVERFQNAHTC